MAKWKIVIGRLLRRKASDAWENDGEFLRVVDGFLELRIRCGYRLCHPSCNRVLPPDHPWTMKEWERKIGEVLISTPRRDVGCALIFEGVSCGVFIHEREKDEKLEGGVC